MIPQPKNFQTKNIKKNGQIFYAQLVKKAASHCTQIETL